ncbi:hypothetical protein J6590_091287, partial [Homalodisca vitripennis]
MCNDRLIYREDSMYSYPPSGHSPNTTDQLRDLTSRVKGSPLQYEIDSTDKHCNSPART